MGPFGSSDAFYFLLSLIFELLRPLLNQILVLLSDALGGGEFML